MCIRDSINCVRIGMLEAFTQDIEVPLKYGVDQCVGDTLCAGGIMYGQRDIPQILAFCKDIREVAAPGAIMLNYANPNAMVTWAANTFGGVETLGLCHGVQGGHAQIAKALGVDVKDLDIICACLLYTSEQNAVLNTRAQENISGVRVVKAFAREEYEKAYFQRENFKQRDLQVRAALIWGKFFPMMDVLSGLTPAILLLGGGIMVIQGHMSLGTLVAMTGSVSYTHLDVYKRQAEREERQRARVPAGRRGGPHQPEARHRGQRGAL